MSNNFQSDKLLHFVCGYAIAAVMAMLCSYFASALQCMLIGIASAVAAALTKEAIDLPLFDWRDIGATIVGGLLGAQVVWITLLF